MTAYELVSLHTQIGDNMNAQLSNWLTILSLYLGAGYLLAHRLSMTAAVTLSAIFVMLTGGWTVVLYRTFLSFVGVSLEIRKLAGLEWHQAAFTPLDSLTGFPIGSMIMLWVGIVAAVVFFFSTRRQNKAQQSQADLRAQPNSP